MKRAALTLLLASLLAGPASAQTLTLFTRYGPAPANADRVMVSGEDGRWIEVAGSGGAYEIQLEGTRFSLLVTCFSAQGPEVTVYRFLSDELSSLQHVCPGRGDVLASPHRLSGEFRTTTPASPELHAGEVLYGPQLLYSRLVEDRASFNLAVQPHEPADLLALYGPLEGPPELADLRRGFELPASSAVLFDFAGGNVLSLEQHELTAPEGTSLFARLVTCNGLTARVDAALPSPNGTLPYAALPSAAAEECDRYELTALALEDDGFSMRLASVALATPGPYELELPAVNGRPLVETVGTDPLRARLSWQSEPGVQFYLGGLTDGRVSWRFVQSAWLAPSVTLPPWGTNGGTPDLRGADFQWSFGVVRGAGGLEETLHAYSQNSVTGQGQFWRPVAGGLAYQVYLTGGPWAPHATELPGSR